MNKLTFEEVNKEIVKQKESKKEQVKEQCYITYSNVSNALTIIKTTVKIYNYLSCIWTIGKVVTFII